MLRRKMILERTGIDPSGFATESEEDREEVVITGYREPSWDTWWDEFLWDVLQENLRRREESRAQNEQGGGGGDGAPATPQRQEPKQCLFSSGAINTISSAAGGAVTGASAAALTGNFEAVLPAAFGGAIVGGVAGALENNFVTAAAGTGVAIGAYATGRASGLAATVTAMTGAAQTYAPQGTSILAAALGGAARGASSPAAYGSLVPRGLAAASGLGRFGTAAALGFVARQATRAFLQQVNGYVTPGCSQ